METLFRIVPLVHWRQAQASGRVPRCCADERHDRIHLNRRADVERAANLWFTPDEQPVALEVDVGRAGDALKWEARTDPPLEVWPNRYAPHVAVEWVVAVHRLDHRPARGFVLGDCLPD